MESVQIAQYESDTSDEVVMEENDGINGNKRISENKKLKKCQIKEKSFDIWCMEMENGAD